jgi:SAM-dependent methyltransferase
MKVKWLMGSDFYNETLSRFYDLFYMNVPVLKVGLDFYLDEIKYTKGSVLEAGVGTGRIFAPALAAGADIYGIDLSENMLNNLKSKIPETEHYRVSPGDIRNFSLDKKFQLIISPFRVFQHLLTIDDQLCSLNTIYDHLKPGGRLIFDVFDPDLKRLTNPVENILEFDGEYMTGKKLQRFASVGYDHSNQVMNLSFRFVWDEDGTEKTDTFSTPLRYYYRFELENLIGRSKFTLEKIYGSFNKAELGDKTNEFIIVCRK